MKSPLPAFGLALAAAISLAPLGSASAAGGKSASVPKGNIVAAMAASKDHKTLVAAVRAAGLVDTLASAGPFTVFAPTDAAFAKLPAGTVDTLLQPANRAQLAAILTYHVIPGTVGSAQLVQQIQANGGSATLTTVQGGTLTASLQGGSVILTDGRGGTARVVAVDLIQSNGVIHVTDAVSLPQ